MTYSVSAHYIAKDNGKNDAMGMLLRIFFHTPYLSVCVRTP